MECKRKVRNAIQVGFNNGSFVVTYNDPEFTGMGLNEIPLSEESYLRYYVSKKDKVMAFQSQNGDKYGVVVREENPGEYTYKLYNINSDKDADWIMEKPIKAENEQQASEMALRSLAEMQAVMLKHKADPESLTANFAPGMEIRGRDIEATYGILCAEFTDQYPGKGKPIEVEFEFDSPVLLTRSRRNATTTPKKTYRLTLFESSQGNLCYNTSAHRGYPVSYLPTNLKAMRIVRPDQKLIEDRKKIAAIGNQIYEGAWTNLKQECAEEPDKLIRNYGTRTMNLKSALGYYAKEVIPALEKAFAEKSNYEFYRRREKRYLRISTKMCDDGIFRAWYHTEPNEGGKEISYLIINPHTAAFCEYD